VLPFQQQLRDSFNQHLDTILAIIGARLWDEEKRQNALAWTWSLWPQCVTECKGDLDSAARLAAINAVKRRQVFGKLGRRGYRDALTGVERVSEVEYQNRCVIERDRRDDEPDAARRVNFDALPSELRGVAKLLARGFSQTAVAEHLELTPRTIHNRVERLRIAVARQLAAA